MSVSCAGLSEAGTETEYYILSPRASSEDHEGRHTKARAFRKQFPGQTSQSKAPELSVCSRSRSRSSSLQRVLGKETAEGELARRLALAQLQRRQAGERARLFVFSSPSVGSVVPRKQKDELPTSSISVKEVPSPSRSRRRGSSFDVWRDGLRETLSIGQRPKVWGPGLTVPEGPSLRTAERSFSRCRTSSEPPCESDRSCSRRPTEWSARLTVPEEPRLATEARANRSRCGSRSNSVESLSRSSFSRGSTPQRRQLPSRITRSCSHDVLFPGRRLASTPQEAKPRNAVQQKPKLQAVNVHLLTVHHTQETSSADMRSHKELHEKLDQSKEHQGDIQIDEKVRCPTVQEAEHTALAEVQALGKACEGENKGIAVNNQNKANTGEGQNAVEKEEKEEMELLQGEEEEEVEEKVAEEEKEKQKQELHRQEDSVKHAQLEDLSAGLRSSGRVDEADVQSQPRVASQQSRLRLRPTTVPKALWQDGDGPSRKPSGSLSASTASLPNSAAEALHTPSRRQSDLGEYLPRSSGFSPLGSSPQPIRNQEELAEVARRQALEELMRAQATERERLCIFRAPRSSGVARRS